LKEIFPELDGTSKKVLKEFLRDHDPDFPEELTKSLNGKKWNNHAYSTSFTNEYFLLKILAERNKENAEYVDDSLNKFILSQMRDKLLEWGYIYEANKLYFNWNSTKERLAVFKLINPDIEKTGKEYLVDFAHEHELITQFLEYNETVYLLQNFGEEFHEKYAGPDGKIRAHFRQILATGRISSSNANMLAYPNIKEYRQAVIPSQGFKFIGADYSSEELVIMGELSGEESWLEAFEKGQDLHSINSSFMYGSEWYMATEPGCAFESDKKKCECTEHKKMRKNGKTLVFLSAYGGSPMALAFKMKVSVDRAEELLNNFYARVPRLKAMMVRAGAFALNNGYIYEPVFGRVKFYEKWKLAVPAERGSIERTAGNFPVQSSGAAILKIFGVLFRRWIIHNNLSEMVRLLLLIHDEVAAEARTNVADKTARKVEYLMKFSAKIAGFDVNADAGIGDNWFSVHLA
jgi:DNA polymerase-1